MKQVDFYTWNVNKIRYIAHNFRKPEVPPNNKDVELVF